MSLEQKREQLSSELKSSRKSEDTEDYLDRYLLSPAGMVMARFFIKIHWSPNAITIFSMLFGVTGGILFYPRNFWLNLLGVLLEIFAAILDCTDGQVARLTHTSSQLGRLLDGLTDGVNLIAVYLALAFRLMGETIPFTDRVWGFWAWPLIVVTGAFFHMEQCRMADYYRNTHLYFLCGPEHSELGRAAAMKAELDALPKDAPFADRAYKFGLFRFTLGQERVTPNAQKLLAALEQSGEVPEALREDFVDMSRPYIQLTNVLTYNTRAFALFILLLLGLHIWYFPFVIVVLGLVYLIMVGRYERIAKELYSKYFSEDKG